MNLSNMADRETEAIEQELKNRIDECAKLKRLNLEMHSKLLTLTTAIKDVLDSCDQAVSCAFDKVGVEIPPWVYDYGRARD